LNIEEYISSGILELYVAGVLEDDVSKEVSKHINKHSEINSEVNNIENAFINLAISLSPNLSTVEMEKQKANLLKVTHFKNSESESGFVKKEKDSVTATKKISLWLKLLAAASILFLIASVLFNAIQYNRLQEAESKILELEKSKNILLDNSKIEKTSYEQQLATIHNSFKIELEGVEDNSNLKAIVYWNKNEQAIMVNAIDLPNPPKGKVYQLWSLSSLDPLIPKSAGLLSNFDKITNMNFEVDNLNDALAFAITLEQNGGSEQPTLTELKLIGTLK